MTSSSLHTSSIVSTLGEFASFLLCLAMSAFLCFGKSAMSGSPWVECFQKSEGISSELYIFSCVRFPSSVQVSDRAFLRFNSDICFICTLFDGGSLASHSSQNVVQTRVLFISHPGSGGATEASTTKVYQQSWKE